MRILTMLGMTLFSVSSFAAETPPTDELAATNTSAAAVSLPMSVENKTTIPTEVVTTLRSILRNYDSIKETVSITPAAVTGLYEISIGMEIFYVSADGKYFMTGSIHDVATQEDLTAKKLNVARQTLINKVDEKEMVVFVPKGETKFTVNVYTDVDCPYCSKFHNEVKELNDAGVKVRYLPFPRAGVKSGTYKKMVSVWCAKDQQKAMTDAKAGRDIPEVTCDNPVTKLYELGQELGVTGTPALILSSGEMIPGYVPASRLIAHLQLQDVQTKMKK